MATTVFDIVRRHVRLPLHSDYGALKTALRDWLAYSEAMPLQTRPTFYAEVQIRVTRNVPAHRTSSTRASVYERWTHASTATAHEQLQRQHVYTKALPLRVWTAVLPWEVQRGLSHASLYPANTSDNSNATTTASSNDKDDEERDPYGVVSVTSAHDNNDSSSNTTTAPSSTTPLSSLEAAPGMLFLMSRSSVVASAAAASQPDNGSSSSSNNRDDGGGRLCFWSGAITQPIDVLFAAATAPHAVAQSPSFAALRRTDTALRIADNHIAAAVAREYVAYNDLHSSVMTLTVCSHGHLDPYNNNNNTNSQSNNDSSTATHQVYCPAVVPSMGDAGASREVVQYVVETRRHLLRDGVRQALRESAGAVRQAAAAGQQAHDTSSCNDKDDDKDVDMVITLELSSELKDDLLRKAQLAVQYVPTLTSAVVQHLRRRHYQQRNSVTQDGRDEATAAADSSNSNSNSSSNDGAARRMRVWLSDTQSVWMTPQELQQMQQRNAQRDTQSTTAVADAEAAAAQPQAEGNMVARDEDDDDDDEAYMRTRDEDEDEDDEECDGSADDTSTAQGATVATTTTTTDVVDNSNKGVATAAAAHDDAMRVRAAQRIAPQQQRPMAVHGHVLAEEDDSRATHLTPSFVGRHEAAVLQQQLHGGSVHASTLVRYPRTHSHAPVDAPIDYELFELCVRLGVAADAVIHVYYQRMLREWTLLLQQLRRARGNDSKDEGEHSTARHVHVAADDVRRMRALVRDTSLQLPGELCALVEAVAQLHDAHESTASSPSTAMAKATHSAT